VFEQDYIMRIILQFAEAIRRSMQKAAGEEDKAGAAELLEASIGEATDIDGSVLLSLAPESIAGVMQISGTDPQVSEYIARTLLLEAQYLDEAGFAQKAELRRGQAFAIAEAFAFGLDPELDILSEEEWEEFFSGVPGEADGQQA
jgi:hypothetical protein